MLILLCVPASADDLVGRIDSLEPQGKRLRAIITPLTLDPPRQTQRLRLSLPSKNNTHLRPGDTVAMIADLGRQQQETDQRFEVFLQESRADRVLNESEHRAFRETFQTLLAEISRIWQRVS